MSSHKMTDFRRSYVRQLAIINKAAEDINVTEQKIASRKLKIKTKVWICSSPGIKKTVITGCHEYQRGHPSSAL